MASSGVNGDGYSDVIVGAYRYDDGQSNEGRAYVYHGSATGLSATAAWSAESDQASAYFGYAVGAAGDVNGDGYADVIVGAYQYDGGQTNEGRAYVYHGGSTGLTTGSADWTAESDQAYANLGIAVGTAGDVNGDGYADVIVGAEWYDDGQTDEGRVYVYQGDPAGLTIGSADWTAESDQSRAYLGRAAGTAGDVNGDGYADVIVGAPDYDHGQTNEGRAFVYQGSAFGLSATADWTAESDQADAHLGYSVGTAGDVDGDGYADVVVGAYKYDNNQTDEGLVYVYHGSTTGLAASAAFTAESDQTDAQLGYSVGTAGDVNGDGYADVIAGAYLYDDGQTDEGRAYVYHGSSTGLVSGAVNWTVESDQVDANLGYSVGTAGDVNGDGYADVIIGAPSYGDGQAGEGRTYVYLGSAFGLTTTADWVAESNQSYAKFGYSSGTAGDVNGDGYADVIVGAPDYDHGQTSEGRAFLYYGNASDGLDLRPRQMRAGGLTPIAPLGASTTALQLRLTGRTPMGRAPVKLQWQVAPLGTPFMASAIISGSSASWTDVLTTGALITQPVSGLTADTPYHWRARLLYYPGNRLGQSAGRWVHAPWNGWAETDLRALAPLAGLSATNDSPTELGQPTMLTATLTAGSRVVYDWALGDGATGDGDVLSHTYPQVKRYTAIVSASNAVSALTTTTSITITDVPIAGLSAANDSPTRLGEVTTLTATLTAGSNVAYAWALGDGNAAQGATVAHTYPQGGVFTAIVTASNSANLVTATTPVTITTLRAGFEARPRFGNAPLTVQFTNTTQGISGSASYRWHFGDGATSLSTGNPTHTYQGVGLFSVSLWVTDDVTSDVQTQTHYIAVGNLRTITYTYDPLYRLTEADYSSGENFQYQYDAAGNRTAYTATLGGTQVTTYTYDAANRLVKVGDVAYTWDALGRLLDDGTYEYTWDAAGRLITVTDGITTLGFLYDGDGNRLARVVNGTLTTHTLDVGLGLPEVLVEHGSGTTRYLHLPTGVATDDGAWTYSAADGLGSVRQRLDGTGEVLAANSYRPFGAPLDGGGGDPYGFTGEWWEGDAGLLFLRARYYDPQLGIFLSPDPVPGTHLYLYVGANPINLVDPSGMCPPTDSRCSYGTPTPPTPFPTPQPVPTPPPAPVGTLVPTQIPPVRPRPLASGEPFKLSEGLMMYPGGWYGQGQISIQGQVMPIYVPPTRYQANDNIQTDISCLPLLDAIPNWNWVNYPGLLGCRCKAVSDDGWQVIGRIGGKIEIPGSNLFYEIPVGFAWASKPQRIHPLQIQAFEDENSGDVYWTWVMPDRFSAIDADTPAPIVFEPWVIKETAYQGVLINGAIQRKMWIDFPSAYDNDGMSGATKFNYAASVAVLANMVAKGLAAPSKYDRLFYLTIQHKQGAYRALVETQAGHTGYHGRGEFANFWLSYPSDGIREEEIMYPVCTQDQQP